MIENTFSVAALYFTAGNHFFKKNSSTKNITMLITISNT